MIKVGDRVKMSALGKRKFPESKNNPHDLVGVVLMAERKSRLGHWHFDCEVEWSNGIVNTYDYRHLDLEVGLTKPLEWYL